MTTINAAAAIQSTPKTAPFSETRRTLERHRGVWARKGVLRDVYHAYFRDMLASTSEHRPIVEIGSGPGFLKQFASQVISTDVEPLPWIDRVVDGCSLPFDHESVGNVVMMDVFHHLPQPYAFLNEASRVLKPGGRIVMLEPWTSTLGYPFYRYVHHEGADRHVDPTSPFDDDKNAMDGNAALPRLVFEPSDGSRLDDDRFGTLALVSLTRLPAFSYLLTGGFKPICLLPRQLLPLTRWVDRLTAPLARLIALRALIVLEKQANRTPACAHAL